MNWMDDEEMIKFYREKRERREEVRVAILSFAVFAISGPIFVGALRWWGWAIG